MPTPAPRLPLCESDLANLRESGLTPATIRANALRTERGALVFPYRDLNGKVNCFARRRPHKPRGDAKYLQSTGSPLRAYFPAASCPGLRDSMEPVFITEGEKKALALSQLGHAAVGIGGVWCGCKAKSEELIDDLAAIPWNGRPVFIVFDYDAKPATRKNVDAARNRLATALLAAGASEVRNVELPAGPDSEKNGVDDFLVTHGEGAAEALVDLIERAKLIDPTAASDGNTVIRIIPLSPPELGDAAYHGLVGRFLRAVAPHTEATDAGVLAHLLPAVGTLIGAGPYVWAGNKQHARINTAVVGPTNTGRKGTAFGPVDLLMSRVDAEFWSRQRVGGLSSGEGLIAFLADKITKDDDGNDVVEPVEKRCYVIENEYSRVLAHIRREGNTLSQTVREAFDSGNLTTLTVNPRHASGAHVSITGHITPEELAERLNHIEMANGFGNRFLWFSVLSTKVMPRTRPIPEPLFAPFVERLRQLHKAGSRYRDRPVSMNPEAEALWTECYPRLREDGPGIVGAMTARGSTMVLRLALIYAMIDGSAVPVIKPEHLRAALAVWEYCEESARRLFASESGDPFCDKLLRLLDGGPMTKDAFNSHLSHKQKAEVGKALTKLEALKLVRQKQVKHTGAGRPATQWERVG